MANITKVRLKNFKSFGNKMSEYTFENGMSLIGGGNAQGKTTLLQAVVYGLFGKVPGLKHLELINNINKKALEVEIELIVGSNTYLIKRGVKPRIFEIYKDGEKINEDSKSLDYQQMLEDEILGINFKTFLMLVSLDATMLSKSFITMSSWDRKTFLEYILDIRILFFIDNIVKQRMNFSKTLFSEAEFKLKARNELLDTERKHLEKIIEINTELKTNKSSELEDLENKQSLMNKKLLRYDVAFEKISEAEVKLRDFRRSYNDLHSNFSELKVSSETTNSELFNLKSLEKQYIGCSGCDKLGDLTNGLDFSKQVIESTETLLENNKKVLLELKSELSRLNEEIKSEENIIKNKQRLKNNKSELEVEISEVNKAILKVKDYKIIPEETSEIFRLEGELIAIEQDIKDLDKKMNMLKKISVLVSDKGIKKTIFKKYIPVFNKYLNTYMQEFELPYNIVFDEEFNVFIIDSGEVRSFHTFSASERLRMNLVIIFSFLRLIELRNSFKMNVLMIDELLDSGLSDINFDLTLEFLRKNFSKDKEVIVISHKGNINPEYFDRIFKIKKENGFSRLELGE